MYGLTPHFLRTFYDYGDFPKDQQANNLESIDEMGNFKWCAESPINSPSRAFTNFVEFRPWQGRGHEFEPRVPLQSLFEYLPQIYYSESVFI